MLALPTTNYGLNTTDYRLPTTDYRLNTMDYQLIIISNPEKVPGEAGIINALFESGLEVFHLRKPAYSESETEALIQEIEPRFRARVVLHQHYSLASRYQLKGIHFTGWFVSHCFARLDDLYKEAKQQAMTVSSSKHQLAELKVLEVPYDYVFLSPVFDSISKAGYKSSFADLESVLPYKKHTRLIALGGIALDKIARIKFMGFDGAAVLGTIWQQPQKAVEVFMELKATWEKKDQI